MNMKKRALLLLLPLLYSCSVGKDGDIAPAGDVTTAANTPGPGGSSQAGVVTAGEWNDLRNWSFWQDVLKRTEWAPLPAQWQLYPTERYTLTLTATDGQPVAGARVTLGDATATTGVGAAVTDRLGRAEFFPNLFRQSTNTAALAVGVSYRGQTFTPAPVPAADHDATRAIAVTPAPATPVDIMFVVDATSSMGDEISYLKTELRDVITRVGAQVPAADLRMASVFYRDQGDDYLTREQPFTADLSKLLTFVQEQEAGGGGDFPEAVEEGLAVALQQQWSAEARCRLLFLVLDAPPHDAARARIQQLTREAARQGIRVIPITASGIDTSTEFLMRSLALSTNGTYVFITNHSGVGNAHLQATVGSYQVEFLNNLMVRLITAYSQP